MMIQPLGSAKLQNRNGMVTPLYNILIYACMYTLRGVSVYTCT